MLQSLRIIGFKSIKEMDLTLAPLNIIIGGNGAGKSNFLAVFKLLRAIIDNNLQQHVGLEAERFLYGGSKVTDLIVIETIFNDCTYLTYLRPLFDTLCFLLESISLTGYHETFDSDNLWKLLRSGQKKDISETSLYEKATDEKANIATNVIANLKAIELYHFHDTTAQAPVKKPCKLDDNRFFRPDASNLPAFLYYLKLKHPENYTEIVHTIQRVAPFFESFILEPDRLNESMIKLRWKHKGIDKDFDIYDFSDGTIRFICLATLLLQPDSDLPSLILLDEPELGLHPYAITLLGGMLKAASSRTQIIAATQSVTLVNQFETNDIIITERQDNASIFKRLTQQEIEAWLEDYHLGEIWERNIIGGGPL